jgi:hypothetical protein
MNSFGTGQTQKREGTKPIWRGSFQGAWIGVFKPLPPTYGPDGRATRLHAGGTHVRSKQRKTKELKTDKGGIDFTYDRAFSPLLVFQSFRNSRSTYCVVNEVIFQTATAVAPMRIITLGRTKPTKLERETFPCPCESVQ